MNSFITLNSKYVMKVDSTGRWLQQWSDLTVELHFYQTHLHPDTVWRSSSRYWAGIQCNTFQCKNHSNDVQLFSKGSWAVSKVQSVAELNPDFHASRWLAVWLQSADAQTSHWFKGEEIDRQPVRQHSAEITAALPPRDRSGVKIRKITNCDDWEHY